jgi:magnesium chelatase family protein
MTIATIQSFTLSGVDAVPVRVEVDTLRRLPAIQIVGMAASSVREAAERVRSAVAASGYEWPRLRVIVNLSPADLRKDGPALDLPIAMGVLATMDESFAAMTTGYAFAGELALDGTLRPIRGCLAMYEAAVAAECKGIVLPEQNAMWLAGTMKHHAIPIFGALNLTEVIEKMNQGFTNYMVPCQSVSRDVAPPLFVLDMSEVHGQYLARRALEIAAAGGHHLMLMGPPGCSKTMLASRLPTILPTMTDYEARSVARVHDAAGLLDTRGYPAAGEARRPFRAPHYSISAAGMMGGALLRPGEVSLAHNGVLFLDELPEFQRMTLELIRDPMETGKVVLSRALGIVTFPARFQLVAAANPCPCGFRGHDRRPCGCSEEAVARYLDRMSGPLLSRMDMTVELKPVNVDDLTSNTPMESSAAIRARVAAARHKQARRGQLNAQLTGGQVRDVIALGDGAQRMLRSYVSMFALSGAAHTRLLRVARTIADLDNDSIVQVTHLAEAMQYRMSDAVKGE